MSILEHTTSSIPLSKKVIHSAFGYMESKSGTISIVKITYCQKMSILGHQAARFSYLLRVLYRKGV